MISQSWCIYFQKIWMRKPELSMKLSLVRISNVLRPYMGQRCNAATNICTGIADYADVLLNTLKIKQQFTNDRKDRVAFVENSNRKVF